MNNKTNRRNMNNFKKLGLSALAGSLAAISAQAGEMAVTGSANVTAVMGESNDSAKSIGTDKDVAFTGSGELDNGYTFTVSTLLTDAYSVSSSYTSLTMGSLGTLTFGTDFGGASYKYDEEVPQAYEQTSDASQNSANIVGNNMDNNSIVYNSPSFDVSGASVSFDLEYTPQGNGVSPLGDGSTTAKSDTQGAGVGAGITVAVEGLKVGVYGNQVEATDAAPAATNSGATDSFEGVAYAKYSYGPVSVGFSRSYLDSGLATAAVDVNTVKVVRTAAGIFEMDSASIAFNVNDNFSVSFTETRDTYNAQEGIALTAATSGKRIAEVEKRTRAYQAAYSMGAMSIKAYSMDTDNVGYAVADTHHVTEIALGLAF